LRISETKVLYQRHNEKEDWYTVLILFVNDWDKWLWKQLRKYTELSKATSLCHLKYPYINPIKLFGI
jgi:hypothetical protein